MFRSAKRCWVSPAGKGGAGSHSRLPAREGGANPFVGSTVSPDEVRVGTRARCPRERWKHTLRHRECRADPRRDGGRARPVTPASEAPPMRGFVEVHGATQPRRGFRRDPSRRPWARHHSSVSTRGSGRSPSRQLSNIARPACDIPSSLRSRARLGRELIEIDHTGRMWLGRVREVKVPRAVYTRPAARQGVRAGLRRGEEGRCGDPSAHAGVRRSRGGPRSAGGARARRARDRADGVEALLSGAS